MMRPTYPNNIACPIDATVLVEEQGQLRCAQGHRFDIARHGYVNLLPVQYKKSKQPGDNKEMVTARTHFLNTHIYQPIAEKINHIMLGLLTDERRTYYILDAACGDGYYLNEAVKALTQKKITTIGVDISKYAIMAAAKRNAQLIWLVGSNKQLPVLPNSIDVILSVFGFPSIDGFAQALNTQGNVILVEANSQHLIELRKLLYDEIEEASNKNFSLASPFFDVIGMNDITYKTKPLTNAELVNLLKMTPHFYRAHKKAIDHVCQQSNISVTVDVSIIVCTKRSMVDD